MNKTSKKGFTLVEIMIVVVIIGLLAAMAIPAFQKVRENAQEKAIINNLRQFNTAAQQYMIEGGHSSAAYEDIVKTDGTGYLNSIKSVAKENYSTLTVAATSSALSITYGGSPGKTVTYAW